MYPENVAADVSPERLRRYFRKAPGGYRIASAVRDLCVFARHDLAADPPFARMDLVSCRNVLFYFDAALQRRVMPLFHYALRPGGQLLLGLSETIGPFADLFVPADRDARLYTRTLAPARLPSGLVAGPAAWGRAAHAPAALGATREAGGLADVQREAGRVLARYAPPGVLVDDHLNILQFRGDTDLYLRHPPGTAGLDLLRMAREGLLPDLRDGIAAARAGAVAVRRPHVTIGEGDGARTIALQITPLAGGGAGFPCFLVVFEDATPRSDPPPPSAAGESELAERVAQLRRELDACREHQQAAAEELKSANEEILASNEEILASNEELQSTNEELQTVNEELGHRNRELGRANDDLHSLLVGVNVPVLVVDRELRIRRLTAQAEAAFGLLATDVGRTLREVRLGLDVADLGGAVARVIDSLEAGAFEARDGDGRWYSVRVRPHETGDNRIDGVVITAIDVDAVKRGEAARRELEAKVHQAQKLESLGVMACGVAHDLNNLLTPVVGYTQMALAELPVASPTRGILGEAERATWLAVELVKQLHAYSGHRRREVRAVDLSELIRDLDGLLARAAGEAELRLELAPTALPVEVDPTQVAQVVLNLVTNAAEAMTAGRGIVTVRTALVEAGRADLSSPYLKEENLLPGPYAALEVSDTGCGMSEETLARLFDPFYTTKFTGRGLGLAAVLGIVRGHRGTVQVRSTPGRGATFRILIPKSAGPAPEPTACVEPDATAAWRGSGTVLVVDDEKPIRGLMKLVLERAGFEVLEAADGEEGLAVFWAHTAAVRAVFADLTMPRMGGLALAEAVRAERPDVPILVMSGYTADEEPGRLAGAQFDGFVRKPFAQDALLAACSVESIRLEGSDSQAIRRIATCGNAAKPDGFNRAYPTVNRTIRGIDRLY